MTLVSHLFPAGLLRFDPEMQVAQLVGHATVSGYRKAGTVLRGLLPGRGRHSVTDRDDRFPSSYSLYCWDKARRQLSKANSDCKWSPTDSRQLAGCSSG